MKFYTSLLDIAHIDNRQPHVKCDKYYLVTAIKNAYRKDLLEYLHAEKDYLNYSNLMFGMKKDLVSEQLTKNLFSVNN